MYSFCLFNFKSSYEYSINKTTYLSNLHCLGQTCSQPSCWLWRLWHPLFAYRGMTMGLLLSNVNIYLHLCLKISSHPKGLASLELINFKCQWLLLLPPNIKPSWRICFNRLIRNSTFLHNSFVLHIIYFLFFIFWKQMKGNSLQRKKRT